MFMMPICVRLMPWSFFW